MEQEIEIIKENVEQEIQLENEAVKIGTITSGTLDITQNGIYDVDTYKNVNVQTQGIVPTGTLNITKEGNYNVTEYENANVELGYFHDSLTGSSSRKAEEYIKKIPELDTSNLTNMSSFFGSCPNLVEVSGLDTSNAKYVNGLFYGCNNLTTIPIMDFSSATDMANMLLNVKNLTDDSINNLLLSCTTATSYADTKTLYRLGFRSNYYSSSRIQALSNYQAFINSGWTIGY